MSCSTFMTHDLDDKDDQLIIIVNADGTITVDPETLQKLVANQQQNIQSTNLSIVRCEDDTPNNQESENDGGPFHVNLTVEGYCAGIEQDLQQLSTSDTADATSEIVDPFSQLDPEHIAKLESVLQSEQAKEILGTNLTENQDLNSVLDILEGKEEVAAASVVHNDHSYTSSIPGLQQSDLQTQPPLQESPQVTPPQLQPQQLVPVSRPLTRGGRAPRVRGRGLLTRGGSTRVGLTPSQLVTTGSTPLILQTSGGKVLHTSGQKTIIVTQSPQRLLTQSSQDQQTTGEVKKVPEQIKLQTTPRLLQRKLIAKPVIIQTQSGQTQLTQQSLQKILSPTKSGTNVGTPETLTSSQLGTIKVLTPVSLPKKTVASRGGARGGRVTTRGGRKAGQSPSLKTLSPAPSSPPPPANGDEVRAALEAMEISPPSSAQPQSSVEKMEVIETPPTSRKKSQTVIVQKIGSKSEIIGVSPTAKTGRGRLKQEDKKDPATSPAQLTSKSPKQHATPKADVSAVLSPRGGKEDAHGTAEEAHQKKKKEKKTPPASVVLGGPELFSAPDIIRRVSTDKQAEPPTPPPHQQAHPSPQEVKVHVLPAHPPLKGFDDAMTPESLLDSIHAEVSKDDAKLLSDALLLDDLTSDDNLPYTGNMNDVLTVIPPQTQGSMKIETAKVETPTGLTRKLPPIELPTTRSASKKAAAKTPQPAQNIQQVITQTPITPPSTKTVEKEKRRTSSEVRQDSRRIPEKKYSLKDDFVSDFEDEEDFESDRESYNSEDDPNRLWCICKKPHNNRFMICCDSCEEWFHGKCVGVTKAMGQQMELQGTEWSCPNCKSKKEGKPVEAVKAPVKLSPGQQTIASLECVTCRKPAKVDSNYCTETCIKKHALKMIALLNQEVEGLQPTSKVIVYEKKSGRIISDNSAPTVSNLAEWLCSHPTFEVHKLSISNKANEKKNDSPLQVQAGKKGMKQQGEGKKVLKQQQIVLTARQSPKQSQGTAGVKQPTPVKQQGDKPLPPAVKQEERLQSPPSSKQQVQVTPKQPLAKTPTTSVKQGEKEKPPGLKQTYLTQKIGSKEIGYSPKQPPKQIQLIQAQPLTVPPLTPKEKRKAAKEKKEDDEEYKPEKPVKIEKPIETPKKSSDTKKPAPEKSTPKDDKKKESSTKEEKKKEEKKKERKSLSESSKSEEGSAPTHSTEPIRANVKRTIQELLIQRVQQDPSISISNDEIKELACSIEEEMFAFFKDTGTKYKAKYRSLVFNIKDPKNLTLYKKILEKSINAEQLIRLSPEELASQELAQWREKEAKHQLEIIKKNELDLIQQAKTVVLKSRKGEEVIEAKPVNIKEIESVLNRTADDWELENAVITDSRNEKDVKLDKAKEEEKASRKSRDRTKSFSGSSRGDGKDKEKVKEREKEKERERESRHRERSRSRSRRSRSRSRDRRRKDKEKERKREKKEDKKVIDKTEETLKEIEEVISQHIQPSVTPPQRAFVSQSSVGGDSDLSDREPSSTVNITTPPPPEEEKPPVWQGFLSMSEVTKLYASAHEVSGSCEDLGEDLPDQLECVGRIHPDSVWDYVSRMKKAGTKDIVVIRFDADNVEEKMNYLSLYSYLSSRNRMAVIGSVCRTVKDFYILPLPSFNPIPQVLLPLDGPGFDDYRPHLLLGIIIRTKKNKHPLVVSSTTSMTGKNSERSYTPPLPDSGAADSNAELPDSGSTTPPLPHFSKHSYHSGLTPPLPDDDNEPYSPGDSYSPEDSQTEAILVNPPDIQKNLEEVNKLIVEKYKQIETLSQVAKGSAVDEEEAPYSPSSSMTPPKQESIPFLDTKEINLPPNLQDILASIKGTPQPSLDVKSDPIVKAYRSGQTFSDDEEEIKEDVKNERSSRDPRQRPEAAPKPKSTLSQLSDSDLLRKAVEQESSEQTMVPQAQAQPPPQPQPPPQAQPTMYQVQPPPPPQPFFYPAPPVGPPPPVVVPPPIMPPPGFHPPPPGPMRYGPVPPPLPPPPPVPPEVTPDRGRKRKGFNEMRGSPMQGGHGRWGREHHEGMPQGQFQRGGGRQHPRFRGGFDRGGRGGGRGGFRGGFRGHHGKGGAGGGNAGRYYGGRERNVQSEWDEEIRNFEQRKARERKRKASRSPSPRRGSRSPRRKNRRSSNSS